MSKAKFTKGEWEIDMINKHDTYLIKTAPKLYDEIESEIKFLTKLMADNFTVNCRQSWEIGERIEKLNLLLAEARGE